jgi:hypothetical protein
MKIKHYQGKVATFQEQWKSRDTLSQIIKRQKEAQRNARLVNIITR